MEKFGLLQLDVEQRLALIDEIWESIDAEASKAVQLTDARRAEIERRLFGSALILVPDFALEEIEDLLAPSKHH